MYKFVRYLIWAVIIGVALYFLDGKSIEFGAYFFVGLIASLITITFETKKERKARKAKEKAEAEQKKAAEEAREAAKRAPACHSKDGVDILTFRSQNNLLTVGNNSISFKIRNRNSYGVLVYVCYKYDGVWEDYATRFEVQGNQLKHVDTLGKAWNKAEDITIVRVD